MEFIQLVLLSKGIYFVTFPFIFPHCVYMEPFTRRDVPILTFAYISSNILSYIQSECMTDLVIKLINNFKNKNTYCTCKNYSYWKSKCNLKYFIHK